MALFDKLQAVAKNAAAGANDMIEIGKLNGKINDENKKIANAKAELGEFVWQQYQRGVEVPAEADAMCTQIKLSLEMIEGLERQIAEIKADDNPQPAAAPVYPAPAGAPAAAGAACVNCGAALAPGAKFCANCGTPQSMEKSCSSCGAQVGADVRFCPSCGAAL